MAKPKIEWNMAGFRELRKAPGVAADVLARANRIANAAGPGHEVSAGTSGGRGRANATVSAESQDAKASESENMTLTKSLDAGR